MRSLLVVFVFCTSTFGCGSKNAKESETTTERASAKSTSAAATADDKHRAADDQATEDLQARRAEEAKVTEAKAAADADTVKAHKVTQDQLQANFDASDRRLNAAKQRVAKVSGTKKKKATAAVAVADTHAATVMASIAKLREASLAQWDAAKAQVESDSATLDKSIDAVEASLK